MFVHNWRVCLASCVVDTGCPTSSPAIVSSVESSVSVHRLRQSALSAAIRIAAAAAGGARLRHRSGNGRGPGEGHHGWHGSWSVGAFVAGLDLLHVGHWGGQQVLNAHDDKHETYEQHDLLHNPVDEWHDGKSH